mmetsp:Transcript_24273/g.53948  ORF Transcript_24273/g.53948 Transcript_24273/m.53948 type:complete len:418 (-) Transcript_24273:145-1398(-)
MSRIGQLHGSDEVDEDSEVYRPLRHRLRAEMETAFRRPVASAQLSDIEARARRLMDQAAVAAPPPLPMPPPELMASDSDSEEAPRPAQQQTQSQKRLRLVMEEADAKNLQVQVQEARRRLNSVDAETTRLTLELKECRSRHWEQQRLQANLEASITQMITEHSSGVSEGLLHEYATLDKKERELSGLLVEARAQTTKWANIAQRQDGMLQQDRSAQRGGDVHGILNKHPAGEVFLSPPPPDSDSEDLDTPRGRLGIPARGRRRDEVPLSSDEEDFVEQVPRQRIQAQRSTALDDDESDENQDIIVPPSIPGQRWRSPIGMGLQDGDSEGSSPGSPDDPSGRPSSSRLGAHVAAAGVDDSPTASEEDSREVATNRQRVPIPALPELAGLMVRQRPNMELEEDGPEVYSDDYEETSRSV